MFSFRVILGTSAVHCSVCCHSFGLSSVKLFPVGLLMPPTTQTHLWRAVGQLDARRFRQFVTIASMYRSDREHDPTAI